MIAVDVRTDGKVEHPKEEISKVRMDRSGVCVWIEMIFPVLRM